MNVLGLSINDPSELAAQTVYGTILEKRRHEHRRAADERLIEAYLNFLEGGGDETTPDHPW